MLTSKKRILEHNHPDFGKLVIRQYKDGEWSLCQLNERVYLTTNQVMELIDTLTDMVSEVD